VEESDEDMAFVDIPKKNALQFGLATALHDNQSINCIFTRGIKHFTFQGKECNDWRNDCGADKSLWDRQVSETLKEQKKTIKGRD